MTLKEHMASYASIRKNKEAMIKNKPHQKTYVFTYGPDGDFTKIVRASNKKDALYLAQISKYIKSEIVNN